MLPHKPPAKATHLLGRLSQQRRQLLATRGLLVLRLPAPPPNEDGEFHWDLEPDYVSLQDTCWYFNASLLNGKWNAYRVLAQGPRIQVWINGQQISDLVHEEKFKSHPKGFIGLQVHGIRKGSGPFEVSWRNIEIIEK